ncbi:MAG: radical SAM protein [Candidatus Alcyoniella australis]|nr:radical SAM protein [Candidatus Alcyoniella australis]
MSNSQSRKLKIQTPIERVSLIYPPYGAVKNEPGIKAVKENYGVFPSLSLAYVGGVFQNIGVKVQFIDANAMQLSLSETIDKVRGFGPQLICFTITTYLFYQTLEWVRSIREATGVSTLLGGVHMGIYPSETMTHGEIDLGVIGEAEETVPELIAALNSGRDLAEVNGLIFRREDAPDGVMVTPPRPLFQDVDNSPYPCRELLPNDRYYSFISQFKNFTPMITSRGCPFHCIFCEQGGMKFRPRSASNVVDEIEQCYHVYKVREIDVFDSSFTTQRNRVIEICDEINRRNLKIYWAIRSRVDLVNAEMLEALHSAGCKRIYYGIESGDPDVLRTLRKETDLAKIKQIIDLTNRIGIDTFGYFMVGSPGETARTIKQSIRFAIKLNLDYAQFSKVTPMPATELYRMLIQERGRDYWSEYILDPSMEIYMPRPGCAMSEDEVQRWTRSAYLRFYFRPKYIIKALLRLKSWREFTRSVYTAWSMVAEKLFEKMWFNKKQY